MASKEDFTRPAVLLNPLAGEPTDADSHIGGPMLWPIDEPWPWCDGERHDPESPGVPGAGIAGIGMPFVGAVQLYRRDFPELPFPEGTDVLQVFLCTLEHALDDCYGPDVRLVWRDSTSVVELIEEEPEPPVREEIYTPTVNVLEPIRFTEYAHSFDRPEELRDEDWPETSAGTKIGGWTCWWQSGPIEFTCPECGSVQRQMLALATREPSGEDVEWSFGRDGNLNILTCPQDVQHPIRLWID
ncbi:uncharacterized protein DUF1963 [Lentzea atacamensis]|uniref:Uncharacterized protein DUF1963 n=1 Tax=Lentzea atacamensis TaxID=531938 RepID=A0ABX9EHW3_9PSEU|nr:DUF1963 domain-containing protein [Lentzea atacamensis]RAS70772.1 uncharacterized protein DUF1963 [Lentzea atacamensis]